MLLRVLAIVALATLCFTMIVVGANLPAWMALPQWIAPHLAIAGAFGGLVLPLWLVAKASGQRL